MSKKDNPKEIAAQRQFFKEEASKVTHRTLLSSGKFYQKITSSSVYYSATAMTCYLLNSSISNGVYNMLESFGQSGFLVAIAVCFIVMIANSISSVCVVETVARVEIIIKRQEQFSGALILKDNLFLEMGNQKLQQKSKKSKQGKEAEEEETSQKPNLDQDLVGSEEQEVAEDNSPIFLDERRIEFSQMIKLLFGQM